jgi:photosystem II stability/assembly factor-like uncharacterized protein
MRFVAVARDGTLYIGSEKFGLYRSADRGLTPTNPLPSGLSNLLIPSIAFDTRGYIYVGTGNSLGTGGLSRSTDGGTTWTPIKPTESSWMVQSILTEGSNLVVLGFFNYGMAISRDGGNSWSRVPFFGNNTVFTIVKTRWGAMLARAETNHGGTHRLYRSTNGGVTWSEVGPASPNPSYTVLAPPIPGRVFAARLDLSAEPKIVASRLLQSTDEGATWEPAPANLISATVTSFAAFGSGIIAGTERDGAYISLDSGAHWIHSDSGMQIAHVRSVVADRRSRFYAATPDGVYRSYDRGMTWRASWRGLSDPDVRSLALDSLGRLYAATAKGLYASTDDGDHWRMLSGGGWSAPARALLCDDSIAYLVDDRGELFAANDAADRLNAIAGAPSTITSIARRRSGALLTGSANGDIEELDAGSWRSVGAAPLGGAVTALAEYRSLTDTSASARILFAAVDSARLFVFSGADNAWREQPWMGGPRRFGTLWQQPGGALFTGGVDAGPYYAAGRVSLGVERADDVVASPVEVAPNPARDRAHLTFTTSRGGRVAIDLVDMLGHPLRHIESDLAAPGRQTIACDLSGMPAGPCLCIVHAGATRATILTIIR